MRTPIAVFAYNRPKHLKLCLEAIDRSLAYFGFDLPLYIFLDAPRKESDRERVEETREVAKSRKDATLILREENFGFRNITEGISSLCNEFGQVIVIEDDVVISPDFLPFMVKALDTYENTQNVFMISGFMYFNSQKSSPKTLFLPTPFIWGWATWKRAWDHYSWEPKGWADFLKNKRELKAYNYFGAISFSKMLEKTMTGKWNTWDTQWMYTVFREKGLCLYPHRSLIWNSGVGGGTHGKADVSQDPLYSQREYYIHGNMELKDFEKPRLESFTFPKEIKVNKQAMVSLARCFLKEKWKREKRLSTLLKRIRLFCFQIISPF